MAKRSDFTSTLEEACACEREYRALEDVRAWKLTQPAFIKAALEQAGADQKRIDQLKARLDRPGLQAAKQSLRNMIRFIEGRHSGFCCTTPTTRIQWLLGDDSVGELASLGFTGLELFALAALEADEATFGPCEDEAAQRATFERLKGRRAELFDALERTWTGEDVLIDTAGLSPSDRDRGHAIVRFKAAPAVTLSPGCGERLVVAALSQRRSDAA